MGEQEEKKNTKIVLNWIFQKKQTTHLLIITQKKVADTNYHGGLQGMQKYYWVHCHIRLLFHILLKFIRKIY